MWRHEDRHFSRPAQPGALSRHCAAWAALPRCSHSPRNRKMAMISFDLPDDALLSMHSSLAEVEHQIRMAAAVKLYELGRLSSGAAARIAGVPRVAFLAKLGDYGVDTFRLTDDELLSDVRNA